MKMRILLCSAMLVAGTYASAGVQTESLRVYTCDTTIASEPPLRVEDEASIKGAELESPTLITLPNGMKAVQFSVRYAKRLFQVERILKVRYTVSWFDDCGRAVLNGANTIDGLALNPHQYQTIQSTAMHPNASRALLRIYVD